MGHTGIMEHATVYRHGTARTVRNLGWLLRNWKSVERFEVRPYDGEALACDAWLVARLRDGGTYETPFASFDLLKDWLHRPVFRGLPVDWCGEARIA